jgi:hypothetical protein
MGVAVFSGATHTISPVPIMGMELLGQSGHISGACFIGYMASGPVGIYHSQIVKGLNIIYIKD